MATSAKRDTLNLRIKPGERSLIDQAARSVGKNRTDFVLDAARRAAEEALLDRTLVSVTPEAYCRALEMTTPLAGVQRLTCESELPQSEKIELHEIAVTREGESSGARRGMANPRIHLDSSRPPCRAFAPIPSPCPPLMSKS